MGGVTSANDLGLWMVDGNSIYLRLREGQALATPFGTRQVKNFVALRPLRGAWGQGNGLNASAGAVVRVIFADGKPALLRVHPTGDTELLAMPYDTAGGTTSTMTSFGLPTQSVGGKAAFIAQLTGDQTSNRAIMMEQTIGPRFAEAARKGDEPVTDDGAMFKNFESIVTNSSAVAFTARLAGDATTKANDSALFVQDDAGLRLVAREGEQPPGIESGAKWRAFRSISLPEGAPGPLFLGTMVVPTQGTANRAQITERNNTGLWVVNAEGVVQLLARTGAVSANYGPVSQLAVLEMVKSSSTQARAMNSSGQVVYRATYRGGTQAIVKVNGR
jgi:hypothetical protein